MGIRMIKAEAFIVDYNDHIFYQCANEECKKLPKFINRLHIVPYDSRLLGDTNRIPTEEYYLKSGNKAVKIAIGCGNYATGYVIFCEGCIDDLYKQLKLVLDRNLWAFK
jgi:hypothetical protein